MKKLSKKFVQLSVVGTLLVAGGLFVAPQVQNSAAQASEPTKLVAFDQQANALGGPMSILWTQKVEHFLSA